MHRILILILVTMCCCTTFAIAQDADKKPEKKAADKTELKDDIKVTQHSVTINGETIKYTATTGLLVQKKEDGSPKASFFFVAYHRDDVKDITKRPVTFSFNGGPGSSSVWLHLGVLGPRRVISGDAENPVPPPYQLVDNEWSILDATDLVFIDPIGTGYSRPAPDEKREQFHGVEQDIASVGEFIRLYATRYTRWSSPKFLIGESYGTTRAAGLSQYLMDKHGLYLNGIMLISSVLNFQTLDFDTGNELPFLMFLPSYTAAAWYHNRLPADLQNISLRQTLDAVEDFTYNDYARALMRGAGLPDAERARTVEQLARFTGLSPTYIERTDLRIDAFRFFKELLRDTDTTIGRFDGRFTGKDRDSAGEYFDYDPSYAVIRGAYTETLNHYVRTQLAFESDLPYEILTGRVHPWDYSDFSNQYVNMAERLRAAMTQNPHMKIFVANGYYDLATPYFATEYTFNHMGLTPELQDNISMEYYEAGHMMYLHQPSLEKLKADLTQFIMNTTP